MGSSQYVPIASVWWVATTAKEAVSYEENTLLKRKALISPWDCTKQTGSCKADSPSTGKQRVVQRNSLPKEDNTGSGGLKAKTSRDVDFTSAHGFILLWEKRALETLSHFPLQEAPGDDENAQTAHSFPGSELSLGCTRWALVCLQKDPWAKTVDLRGRNRLEKWKQEQFHVNVGKDKKKSKTHWTWTTMPLSESLLLPQEYRKAAVIKLNGQIH